MALSRSHKSNGMTTALASPSRAGTAKSTKAAIAEITKVLGTLLEETAASRTTLRLDDDAHGWRIDTVAAEARAPRVPSLKNESSIRFRTAATTKWLAQNRRNLIQP